MGSTITKAFLAIVVGLAVIMGFMSLLGDITNNYEVENTTGMIGELNKISVISVDNLTKHTASMSDDVEGVKELQWGVGTIVGSIVDAIKLPFKLIGIALNFISIVLGMIGLPGIINKLLIIVISMLVIYGVLKLILGRDKI